MNRDILDFLKKLRPYLRGHHEICEIYLSAIWASPLTNVDDDVRLADAYLSTNCPIRVYETSKLDSSVTFCPQLKSLEAMLISEMPAIVKIACLLYLRYKSKKQCKNFEYLIRLLEDSYDFIHNSLQFWRRRELICSEEHTDYQLMTTDYLTDRLYFKKLYGFIVDASKFLQTHLIRIRQLYPFCNIGDDVHYEFGSCTVDLDKGDKFAILNMFEGLIKMFKNLCSKVLCTLGAALYTEYNTKDIYEIQAKLNEPIEYMVLNIPPTAFALHTEYNTVQRLIKRYSGRIPEFSNQADEFEQSSSSSDSSREPKLSPFEIEILRQQYERKAKFHKMEFETRGFGPLRLDTVPPVKRRVTPLFETTPIELEDKFDTTSLSDNGSTRENKNSSKTSTKESETPPDSPLRHDTLLPEKRSETPLYETVDWDHDFDTPTIFTFTSANKSTSKICPDKAPDSPLPLPKPKSDFNTLTASAEFTTLYKTLYKWKDLLKNDKQIPLENIDKLHKNLTDVDMETLIRNYNYRIRVEESAIPEEMQKPCLRHGAGHIMNSYLRQFLTNMKTTYERAQFVHNNIQLLGNLERLGPRVADLITRLDTCQNHLTTFGKVLLDHIEKNSTNKTSSSDE